MDVISPQKKQVSFLCLCLVRFARGILYIKLLLHFVDASGSESEVFAAVLLGMCGQMPSERNDFGGDGVYEVSDGSTGVGAPAARRRSM